MEVFVIKKSNKKQNDSNYNGDELNDFVNFQNPQEILKKLPFAVLKIPQ